MGGGEYKVCRGAVAETPQLPGLPLYKFIHIPHQSLPLATSSRWERILLPKVELSRLLWTLSLPIHQFIKLLPLSLSSSFPSTLGLSLWHINMSVPLLSLTHMSLWFPRLVYALASWESPLSYLTSISKPTSPNLNHYLPLSQLKWFLPRQSIC